MDRGALLLTLAAATFHAAWNLQLHRFDDRMAAMAVASLVSGLVLLPAMILAFPGRVLGLAFLSALGETAYAVTLSQSYARGSMSVAYPIGRGTSPLLVTVLAFAFLGQRPSVAALVGACALLTGLAIVATRGGASRPAIAWAVSVGFCITSYSVIDAGAVRQTNPLGYVSFVLLIAGVMQVGLVHSLKRLRGAVRAGTGIGLGTIASYGLVLYAFTLAPAGRVSTVREVAVLLGLLAAREKPGWRVWAGASLVVAGAILAGI